MMGKRRCVFLMCCVALVTCFALNTNVVLARGVTIVCDRTFVVGRNSTCGYAGVTSAGAEIRFLDEDTKRVVASTAIDVTNTNDEEILELELGVPSSLETGREYELAMYDGTARTYAAKTKVKVVSNESARESVASAKTLVQVETDKPVYAPGQKIKIRALVADIENAALIKQKDGATTCVIEVKDSMERTIFKKSDASLDVFGVATVEVAIEKEQPPFGWWTVKAEVEVDDGVKISTEGGFNVEEYVLPSFDVTLDASSMPLYALSSKSENVFTGRVQSSYTYGKHVEGKTKIIFKRPTSWSSNYNYVDGGGFGNDVPLMEPAFGASEEWDGSGGSSSSSSLQTSDILYESSWLTLYGGSATFVASISKSILEQSWSQNLEACAMVEESTTKEIRNSTILVIPIIREAFAHQTFRSYQSPAFKPGLPMKHTIQLSSDIPGAFNGTGNLGTLDFTLSINKMNSYSYYGDSNAQTISAQVSSSGALEIEFDAPANDLSCCASYEDETNYNYVYGSSSQKCCLQGANVQLVKNAASRDFVRKILAPAGDDMSTTELDALVPYLSVYFSRDTSSAKAPVESVVINAQCTSAETCEFTLASSKSNVAFAYAVVDAEGLGRGVLESGTFSLSSTENEKTVAMTYSNIASTSSAHVSVAIWSVSGSVYSETYLAGTTSDVFLVPGTSVSLERETEIAFPYDITMSTNVSETNVVSTGTDIKFTIGGAPNGARSYILAIDEAVVIQSGGNTSALDATTFLSNVYGSRTNTLHANSETWPCDTTYNENDIKLDRVTIISTYEIANYCNPSSLDNGGVGIGIPEVAFAMDDVASSAPVQENMIKSGTDTDVSSSSSAVRTLFPETWLWETSDSGSFEATAPDSITTWSITAFTSHPTQGISIMKNASEIIVFREFFISPKVPYSITRGETVEIVLTVFNYLKDEDLSVTITAEDVTTNAAVQIGDSKTLTVSKNSADSVTFDVSPTVLGSIKLRFSASGTTTSTDSESKEYRDAVEKSIVVNPEGVFKTTTVSKVFRRSAEDASETFTLNAFPNGVSAKAIKDTYSSFITVVGDIMGPSIQNINKFVQIPMGCGEQNLLLLAPNVYVAEYLNSANKLTSALKTELSNNIIMGYSRELTYFHPSGGVSAFGTQSDKSASLWLTAFCSKVFASAKRSSESRILDGVSIDATVQKGAIDFMISTQGTNGAFSEPGVVLHSEMQSQSGDKFVLSSYAALSLIETVASIDDATTKSKAQSSIASALTYVASSLESVKSAALQNVPSAVYSAIVSTYAFASACASLSTHCDLANSWKTDVLEQIGRSEVDGATYYGGIDASNSLKIESTAYVVLIYAKLNDSGNNFCYSALKFLLQQRNEFGGYGSTQDTVVALEALSTYAKLTREASNSGSLLLSFSNEVGAPSFTVDATNFDTFNTVQIAQRGAESFDNLDVSGDASGSGVAVASYTVRWYETVDLTEDTSNGLFTIDVTTRIVTMKKSPTRSKRRRRLLTPEDLTGGTTSTSSVEDAEMLQMRVCVKKAELTNGVDGMALLRVPMFSGFQPVESSIANLDPEREYVKRVEVDPITNALSLYIEKFPSDSSNKLCATFDARRVAEVKDAQDVPGAQISMYYQQDKYRNAVMKSTGLEVGRFPEDNNGGGGITVEPDSAPGLQFTFVLASVIAFAFLAID